jgi:hypothetical protein
MAIQSLPFNEKKTGARRLLDFTRTPRPKREPGINYLFDAENMPKDPFNRSPNPPGLTEPEDNMADF